jgi:hypothetical protein
LEDITGKRVHISVGIEGNSNASYLSELGSIYGPERVLVYQLPERKFIRFSDISKGNPSSIIKLGMDLLENTPFFDFGSNTDKPEQSNGQTFSRKDLPDDTAAVHGFFTPSLFKGVFENPFISIILKDPLERMITLFETWKNNQGDVDWRVTVPFDKKLPFTEFALQPDFINFQSKCLGSKRLGDFDLVGVAECQSGFIAQLKNKDWTGYINPKNIKVQFGKPKYKKIGVTEEFLKEFQESNNMDYAIYRQAKEFIGYC